MTATDDAPIVVADHPERRRFEIHVGDALAGFTEYRPRGTSRSSMSFFPPPPPQRLERIIFARSGPVGGTSVTF